jgi:outer membrane lipoprotein carrier protein
MLFKCIKSLILCCLLLPVWAQADAASQLMSHLKALDSMSSDFQQLTLDAQGTQIQQNSGQMSVARGNRFRWHIQKPDEQLVVADGKQVWVYDPGLEQVVIKPLAKQLSATPALLFGGSLSQIRDAFSIEIAGQQDEHVRFVLIPKDKQAMFTRLEISFDGKVPLAMRLVDSLGQKTLIDFSHVDINPGLPSDTFTFAPPAGVDVIRQQP